jgi:hypothetical protein
MRCTAALIPDGCSSPLPAIIVEVTADDLQHAEAMISRLTEAGLARVRGASEMSARAAGWMALARPGLDRVDVLMRASGRLRVFFAGECVLRDDWLESVARTGYCILLAGSTGLSSIPDGVPDTELVTRMVDAAATAGLVAGGLIPVYLPDWADGQKAKPWPGTVIYRLQGSRGAAPPLGLSITLDLTAELAEAADLVRAEANGMGYEWARQRLAVELLLRGQMMPPRIVDQIAEDITFAGPAGWAHRSARAAKTALATSWLFVRTVTAFASRRPLPHWHILGTHVVGTCERRARLEVTVDPYADELLAVGESGEIHVWLGIPRKFASTSSQDDIVVYRGDYRLGVLGDVDGTYRAILLERRHAHTILMTDATRSRTADGSWRLRVHSPN